MSQKRVSDSFSTIDMSVKSKQIVNWREIFSFFFPVRFALASEKCTSLLCESLVFVNIIIVIMLDFPISVDNEHFQFNT